MDDDTEPLFKKGNPNPRKLGFFSLRSSAGDEPDPERLQEAARILGREPAFTDEAGYECELIAAAISASNGLAYVESRAKDAGPHPHGVGGRSIDISIRIHLVEGDGTNRSAPIGMGNLAVARRITLEISRKSQRSWLMPDERAELTNVQN
jgi:hypothetical protein